MVNSYNSQKISDRKSYISLAEFEAINSLPKNKPIAIVDLKCKIIFTNDSFIKTFNYDSSDLFLRLNSEPDISSVLDELAKSYFKNFNFELFLPASLDRDNDNFIVDIEKIIIDSGEYFLLIFESMFEKLNLESRINNIIDALEYGNVPVLIADRNGNITYSTKSFENILQNDIENYYMHSIDTVVSNMVKESDLLDLQSAIENKKDWIKTVRVEDLDGKPTYKELKLSPLEIDWNRKLNFIFTASDITSYILKNQYVEKSESRLRSIINNISDLLIILKFKEGEYYFENANDNFCTTFNIEKNFAYRNTINAILEETLIEKIHSAIKRIEDNSKGKIDFTYEKPGGNKYNTKITSIFDPNDNEILYIISMKDITEQVLYETRLKKAYEKETHLNLLKTALLENMSHEIRTPFNAIMGYSEIIDECIQSHDYDSLRELTNSIKDVMQRVLNVFSNVVEVSEVVSGEVELEKVELNCIQVLKSVYNKKLDEAEKKKLFFELNLEENEIVIDTDWIKLEKVISSLVDNSIKFTDEGKIKLEVCREDRNVVIAISDTGVGLDMKNINKLLEPFVQQEESYTRNYEGGAGLGLTIAYKFTQLLGGEFNIESRPNIGTKITLKFPLKR